MIIIYSLAIGLFPALINYYILYKKGFTSLTYLFLGFFAFTGIAFTILKFIS